MANLKHQRWLSEPDPEENWVINMTMYSDMENSHPSLKRGIVWCRTCGRSQKVNSTGALQNGWPKCCGHTMGKNEPFAACYWDTPEGRIYSLRSEEGGQDVSEIATQFGGGGHKHAAGFKLASDELHRLESGC